MTIESAAPDHAGSYMTILRGRYGPNKYGIWPHNRVLLEWTGHHWVFVSDEPDDDLTERVTNWQDHNGRWHNFAAAQHRV